MIEVPYTVKKALRNGDMLKKYRIVVLEAKKPISTILTPPFTYTAPKDDTYTFFNGETGYGFSDILVKNPDGTYWGVPVVLPPMGASDYDTTTSVTVELVAGAVVTITAWSSVTYVEVTSATPDTQASFTIDNDNLVKESVSIDERMCSGSTLKFGLCEGSSLEFQYFGYPNIRGRRIQVFIDVQYRDNDKSVKWYTIPMGYFTVDQCSTQASTGIIKALAYNKLKSEYLDEKKNDEIMEEFANMEEVCVDDILNLMLGEYAIDKDEKTYIDERDLQRDTPTALITSYYRYSNLYGDQGPLGPGLLIINNEHTTSTNILTEARAWVHRWSPDSTYPVKVRFKIDFDEIDKRCEKFLVSALDKASINQTTDTMMSRIVNMTGDPNSGNDALLQKWFFQVYVTFTDGTKKRFSHTGHKYGVCDGTFADLNKITLENVSSIIFMQPNYLRYGKNSGNGRPVSISASGYSGRLQNELFFHGDTAYYQYFASSTSERTVQTYMPPLMIGESTGLPYNGLAEYITVESITNLSSADLVKVKPAEMADVTLRDLQSAVYETAAEYGQIDRVTDLFSGVSLGHERLYPADTLYPANNLYPGGNAARAAKSSYQKLWTDSVGAQTFRYLIITYKGIETDEKGNESEKDFTLQRTVNPDGTTDYNMSDNWIFRNLIWTAEDVGTYADAMVAKMKSITWFPFEMWAPGLPFLETGDELEITTKDGTYTSYILQRSLSGIQNLQDTFINGELDIF